MRRTSTIVIFGAFLQLFARRNRYKEGSANAIKRVNFLSFQELRDDESTRSSVGDRGRASQAGAAASHPFDFLSDGRDAGQKPGCAGLLLRLGRPALRSALVAL